MNRRIDLRNVPVNELLAAGFEVLYQTIGDEAEKQGIRFIGNHTVSSNMIFTDTTQGSQFWYHIYEGDFHKAYLLYPELLENVYDIFEPEHKSEDYSIKQNGLFNTEKS